MSEPMKWRGRVAIRKDRIGGRAGTASALVQTAYDDKSNEFGDYKNSDENPGRNQG
jgi:hypothetical protein